MIASVERSAVSGEVYAPPSKSYTHRAILITALGPGGTVKRPLLSADTRATVSASEAFGARITLNGEVKIEGVSDRPQTPEDVINVLNSGTTLRFCSAVAALTDGAVLTGDASIRTRPNGPLLEHALRTGRHRLLHSQQRQGPAGCQRKDARWHRAPAGRRKLSVSFGTADSSTAGGEGHKDRNRGQSEVAPLRRNNFRHAGRRGRARAGRGAGVHCAGRAELWPEELHHSRRLLLRVLSTGSGCGHWIRGYC